MNKFLTKYEREKEFATREGIEWIGYLFIIGIILTIIYG